MSGKSVLEASQPGNTQADRTKAAEDKARVERLKEENEIANASGNQPMSTDYIKRFYAYMKNETSTPTIETGTSGIIKDTRKLPRPRSPFRETKKGGKSRKHRGSRKNKKSRRR